MFDLLGDLFEALGDLFGAGTEAASEAAGAVVTGAAGFAEGLHPADVAFIAWAGSGQGGTMALSESRSGVAAPALSAPRDAAEVDPVKRRALLADLERGLQQRIARPAAEATQVGAIAHDRLMLRLMHDDVNAAWEAALDSHDTHALAERLERPYPVGSAQDRAYLQGFLGANRALAEHIEAQVA